MHIPDGYLSPSTCLTLGGIMMPIWYRASNKLKQTLDVAQVPFMAVGAVFSFLIMMFNVPVFDGTSAHAVGAVFLAIVLGPWAAVISVSIALFIQALVFGDGGILAFGANAFNMAFIMPFVGYYTYKAVGGKNPDGTRRIFAAVAAGYIGLNFAALLAAIEFGLQPLLFTAGDGTALYCPYGLNVAIPAMMGTHLLVAGVIEGIVTGIALGYAAKMSPELIYRDANCEEW